MWQWDFHDRKITRWLRVQTWSFHEITWRLLVKTRMSSRNNVKRWQRDSEPPSLFCTFICETLKCENGRSLSRDFERALKVEELLRRLVFRGRLPMKRAEVSPRGCAVRQLTFCSYTDVYENHLRCNSRACKGSSSKQQQARRRHWNINVGTRQEPQVYRDLTAKEATL